MHYKNRISMAVYCVLLIILIFDSKTALYGAREGLETALSTIMPSMFPFIFLIGLLARSFERTKTNRSLPPLWGIPRGTQYLYITGLIGGYPAGAKCVHNAYQDGQISKKDAEHLLLFCNNPGPAFIFGVLGCVFRKVTTLWVIWLIQILSSLLTAFLFKNDVKTDPSSLKANKKTVIEIFHDALHTTGTICGWIILGKVLLSFLNKWILCLLPREISVLLGGMIELSNGCISLQSGIHQAHQIILCSVMLTTGGLCIIMQIASVTNGLSMRSYFLGKSVQLPIVIILASIYSDYFLLHRKYTGLYIVALLLFLLFVLLIRQRTKNNTGKNRLYRV